ncbi:MAG: hypothetical protein EAZ55_05590 [Cytophagales bacterium]|nr:MAG: hypothetical protein EAZ55_05590 [Cytophagales bacterium]
MEKNTISLFKQNKRLLGILFSVVVLLCIPFVAMQFTQEVAWSSFDFLVAFCLLSFTGLSFEFIMRNTKTTYQKVLLTALLLMAFLLIWIELAVGIFGSPFAGS